MSDDEDNVVQFRHESEAEALEYDRFLIEEGFDLLAGLKRLSPPLRKQILNLIQAMLAEKDA